MRLIGRAPSAYLRQQFVVEAGAIESVVKESFITAIYTKISYFLTNQRFCASSLRLIGRAPSAYLRTQIVVLRQLLTQIVKTALGKCATNVPDPANVRGLANVCECPRSCKSLRMYAPLQMWPALQMSEALHMPAPLRGAAHGHALTRSDAGAPVTGQAFRPRWEEVHPMRSGATDQNSTEEASRNRYSHPGTTTPEAGRPCAPFI